jgi:hypothetical protein
VWLAVGALAAAGCGAAPAGKLSGKVTLDGKAVRGGTVLVVSANGIGRSSAIIGADGTYVLEKAPVGKVKLAIAPPPAPPGMAAPPPGAPKPPAAPKQVRMPDITEEESQAYSSLKDLPDRYQDAEQSGLTFEVHEGENTFDITLSRKKPGRS